MKNSSKTNTILLVIIIILLVLGFSYLLITTNKNNKPESINSVIDTSVVNNTQTQIGKTLVVPSGWKVYADAQVGLKFAYPQTLGTKYANMREPAVEIGNANLDNKGCYLNDNQENQANTSNILINDIKYCLSISSDAGAGSLYTNYHYTTYKNNNYITITYTVSEPNGCSAYMDTIDYLPCLDSKKNRENLVINPIKESLETVIFK
jgi:hypothetical protein